MNCPPQTAHDWVTKADAEPNYAKRVALYQQASIQVMKFLPVIPYVWAGSGIAFTKAGSSRRCG